MSTETPQDHTSLARSVYEKIETLLREHGCVIQTLLSAEPVGQDASRALISSRWGVVKIQEDANAEATAAD